jgi:ketosteroid isomerase-like protein
MALSNVEVIRDHYAATNERDFKRAMSHYAEDVVLVVRGRGITSGTFEGREATGEWFGDWFRTFDRDSRFKITELDEREDGSVRLAADFEGQGGAGGGGVTGTVVWEYRLRDGKIVHVEGAAGLEASDDNDPGRC